MTYNIDPNQYYSSAAVCKMKVLPWKSPMTFNAKLQEQKWIDIFNPIVEQKGVHNWYHIKGANIIKFIELANSGKLYE